MLKKGYSDPKVYDAKGNIKKEWCVGFSMTNPATGEYKQFQIRRGINKYHTKPDRYKYGKVLAGLVLDALKEGWNPFEKDFETFFLQWHQMKQAAEEQGQSVDDLDISELSYAKMPFIEALDFALESRQPGLKPDSVKAYRIVKDFAKAAALKIGGKLKLAHLPVGEIKRAHIKLLLDQIQRDREATYKQEYRDKVAKEKVNVQTKSKQYKPRKFKLQNFTGNTYNKYRDILYTLFEELAQYDAVEYNPCDKIADKPEIDTNKHRHATAKEERIIKKYLREKHIRFYIFLAFEELAGLRPNEILSLQVKDINYLNQWFDLWEDEAKTRIARKVPIPNSLLKLIRLLNLEAYAPDEFIFSVGMFPGTHRIKRDKATKLWNKLVRRDLGIDVTMYSFKGLGGEKKREANIELKVVSQQSFGHSTVEMSKRYLEREEDRNRRKIIENTPDFDD